MARERKVAYMEEADEGGNAIEDTKTYAASTYEPSTAPSPAKEQPNTSRARRDRARRGSSSPVNVLTDSDSTVHPSTAERREHRMKASSKDKDRERARSRPPTTRKMAPIARPSIRPSKTAPVIQTNSYRRPSDESSYYGVEPVTTSSSRSRAQTARPTSYYGPSRPPPSNQRYYAQPAPGTSYPAPSWTGGPAPYPAGAPPPPPQQLDYPGSRPQQHQSLLARFNRPQSAIGHRPLAAIQYGDDYEQENEGRLVRRTTASRKSRDDEDRMRMPPPARPASARPVALRPSPFAPPPGPPSAPSSRHVGFEDDDFDDDGESLYEGMSPLAPYDYNAHVPVPRMRRPSMGAPSALYDAGPYRTEVAGKAGRRASYYGQSVSSGGSGFEDKLRTATSYQDEVNGGPPMPLTAETLRKAGRNGATSSRSTRSSGSRDESDYRQSATTRTTRSSNDEDVTIRVKGEAILKVGGAKMQCRDAEININSRPSGGTTRGGSDQDSNYFLEDRRPARIERPPTRARSNSQAGSYTRTVPIFEGYDGYGYSPRAGTPHGWA